MTTRLRALVLALTLLAGFGLAACGNDDPLETGTDTSTDEAATDTTAADAATDTTDTTAAETESTDTTNSEDLVPGGGTVVVGSQDYYSNEIIAETYAQALEAAGYTVDRQFRIGQREAYLPEIESGSIDLFPEYSGPLLQYWVPDTEARLPDDVYAALTDATPAGLRVLVQSPATDQDSYVVTRAFADQWGLTTIEDLAKVTDPMTMGANSEAESRPNGPTGLADVYGIDVGFTPIEDGGGPLTIKALNDGDIQLAIVYTADPTIAENDLVVLEDTKGLFLSSNVVPVASDNVDAYAESLINTISAAMTPDELISMNARSVNEQLPADVIASEWLADKGIG